MERKEKIFLTVMVVVLLLSMLGLFYVKYSLKNIDYPTLPADKQETALKNISLIQKACSGTLIEMNWGLKFEDPFYFYIEGFSDHGQSVVISNNRIVSDILISPTLFFYQVNRIIAPEDEGYEEALGKYQSQYK